MADVGRTGQQRGALVVVPGRRSRSAGVDPRWSAAGSFAGALEERLGAADVLTPAGLFRPAQVAEWGVRLRAGSSVGRPAVRRLPPAIRLGIGDLRELRRAIAFSRGVATDARPYDLVVQFHRRFNDAGHRLAAEAGVPLVLRLEALEVREQREWGLRRPGFGSMVERLGELRLVRRADLVASVSSTLDEWVAATGIPEERRIVVPNGVDLDRFRPGSSPEIRDRAGLGDRPVVGWVGGFRPFHGLHLLPSIVERLRVALPDAIVCLVGEGPARPEMERALARYGDTVRFVGAIPHEGIADWIRAFDICLLLATQGSFHYSPMKLYEYMACAKPVVAISVGDVGDEIDHGRTGLLTPPGDPDAIAATIAVLAGDRGLQRTVGEQARATVERRASWGARVDLVLDRLRELGWPSRMNGVRA